MTRTAQRTFSVASTGVGRTDYSQDVQKSVEPITFSWQETYAHAQAFALNVGETATFDVSIPQLYQLSLYNFYLSCYPVSDIRLVVQHFVESTLSLGLATWDNSFSKTGNGFVDVTLEKGQKFIGSYRVIADNLGLAPIDCYFSAHGMIMKEDQLIVVGGGPPVGLPSLVP